jgi:hypothetical protein
MALPAVIAECGTICVIPDYIPQHWHRRLSAVIDDRGIHFLMGGWNNGEGHAKARMGGKTVYCYRWVMEKMTSRTLSRFNYVDHQCQRKPCITFECLEVTTPGENTYRGPGRHTQYKKPEVPF